VLGSPPAQLERGHAENAAERSAPGERVHRRRVHSLETPVIFPLRLKLSLLASILLVLGIGTVSWLLLETSSDALEQEARKRGRFMALNLARAARDPLLLDDDVVMASLLDAVASEGEVRVARLVDTDGAVVASSKTEQDRSFPRYTRDEPIATSAVGERLIVAARMSFRDVQQGGDVDLGEAQVVLDLDRIVGSVRWRAQRDVAVASGGLLTLGVLIAFALSGRITRPLQRLRLAAQALAAGDTSAHVDARGRDEVADLTRAFNHMSESLSQKDRVESAFRRYVSDHVLREVLDTPEPVKLRGESREVTILFIDLRNYTQMAHSLGPERIVAHLNEGFELMTNRLLEHGATVDKYIGDAVLAYFGAPIESPDHVERAVAAAIAIQRSIEERNRKLASAGQPFEPLDVGIGIQVGPVVLGNIGSEFKMDFTVIGDAVNVANRLQKLAGPGEIMITEDVRARLGDRVRVAPLGLHVLEGREEPIEVLRVLY
jgi:adenylate cyclase